MSTVRVVRLFLYRKTILRLLCRRTPTTTRRLASGVSRSHLGFALQCLQPVDRVQALLGQFGALPGLSRAHLRLVVGGVGETEGAQLAAHRVELQSAASRAQEKNYPSLHANIAKETESMQLARAPRRLESRANRTFGCCAAVERDISWHLGCICIMSSTKTSFVPQHLLIIEFMHVPGARIQKQKKKLRHRVPRFINCRNPRKCYGQETGLGRWRESLKLSHLHARYNLLAGTSYSSHCGEARHPRIQSASPSQTSAQSIKLVR